MKRLLKYIAMSILILIMFYAVVFIDITPDVNSNQTTYYGNPTTTLQEFNAHLSNSTENIFWFVHVTDVHIGAYSVIADNRQNFRDFFENVNHINPSFIVDTGDLTNGIIPLPTVQDVEQWRDRYNILAAAGMINTSYYYDLVGNHDGYNDSLTFSYYMNWSVQKQLQYTWNRTFSFGNYTFIALNSAADSGAQWPGGTSGDLNQAELDWFEQQLNATTNSSNLTIVFTHHPERDVGHNTTSITEKSYLELLEAYNVSAHIFGHGHENIERNQGGTICIETDSLGMSFIEPGYRIFAVDNEGISCKFQPLNTWPAVLITCPIDRGLTMQAFDIPNDSKAVPIRALVFDENAPTSIEYKIDDGTWTPMNLVSGKPDLWNASFDASVLTDTDHKITVRARSSSGTATDSITIRVGSNNKPEIVNGPLPDFIRTVNCDDWVLNLSMYEWDRFDRGTQLNLSVSNGINNSLCSVEITDILNNLVLFTPVRDAIGTVDVTFTLNNSRGEETLQIITISLVDRMNPNSFQLYLALIIVIGVAAGVLINFLLMRRSRELPSIPKK